MENKTCKQCNCEFIVDDDDLAFYKKISPTFGDKTFEIPPPSLCPDCRNRRRTAVRNVTNLHKRKCDLCQKEIVSMYSSDKTDIKVYCSECWWSDKWDPTEYAQGYDSSRSFIEQVIELKKKVPQPALMYVNSENSDYSNLSNDNKNCYLIFLSGRNEDVYYGYWSEDSKSCVDISYNSRCELCFEGINLGRCYNVHWSVNCGDCRDSYFIEDCDSCKDCILCSRLSHKQYCYKNEQYEKEQYEKMKSEFVAGLEIKLDDYKKEFQAVIQSQPKKFSQMLRCENCSGDNVFDSKNCHNCFMTAHSEECKYCYDLTRGTDSYDITGFGIPIELVYESQNIGLGSARCAFVSFAYQLADSYYCEHCYYSRNLFGSIGIRNHGEYFILNKKYSQDEYERLCKDIVSDMQERGEWGEFFPAKFSAFDYNETLADIYYPLKKEESQRLGYGWQEDDYDIGFNGTPYEPLPIKTYEKDDGERKKLLDGVLKCQKSGRPYKISPQELLFYIKNGLPIPRLHYMIRMQERLERINLFNLYHRQCMCEETGHDHDGRCKIEFETSYSPKQEEKVYCEKCYWAEEK